MIVESKVFIRYRILFFFSHVLPFLHPFASHEAKDVIFGHSLFMTLRLISESLCCGLLPIIKFLIICHLLILGSIDYFIGGYKIFKIN